MTFAMDLLTEALQPILGPKWNRYYHIQLREKLEAEANANLLARNSLRSSADHRSSSVLHHLDQPQRRPPVLIPPKKVPPPMPPRPLPTSARPSLPRKTEEASGPAISMVLYGPTGTGKTSFAANFPRCGFLIGTQEQGIIYLKHRKLVPEPVFIHQFEMDAYSWPKLIAKVNMAIAEPIDTLVIESLIDLQTMCFMHHAKKQFKTNEFPEGDMSSTGFFAFQKGPKNAANFEFPDFMEAINRVLLDGKNVIITGHSMDKQEVTPTGTVYQKSIPVCEKELWQRIAKWASIVGFMNSKVIQDSERSKGLLKKVAKADTDRLLYVDATAWCEAKNWYGLNAVINCGDSGKECYDNFMQALKT